MSLVPINTLLSLFLSIFVLCFRPRLEIWFFSTLNVSNPSHIIKTPLLALPNFPFPLLLFPFIFLFSLSSFWFSLSFSAFLLYLFLAFFCIVSSIPSASLMISFIFLSFPCFSWIHFPHFLKKHSLLFSYCFSSMFLIHSPQTHHGCFTFELFRLKF